MFKIKIIEVFWTVRWKGRGQKKAYKIEWTVNIMYPSKPYPCVIVIWKIPNKTKRVPNGWQTKVCSLAGRIVYFPCFSYGEMSILTTSSCFLEVPIRFGCWRSFWQLLSYRWLCLFEIVPPMTYQSSTLNMPTKITFFVPGLFFYKRTREGDSGDKKPCVT